MSDLDQWKTRPLPQRNALAGRLVTLEPLDPARHGDDLFEAANVADAEERFRWLFEHPPANRDDFQRWLEKASTTSDPLFFAVCEKGTGRALGRQALMRIDAANGVAEIGSIYWGPELARTAGATEAVYLFARHVFDDLGYRRFEWKCNSHNEPSRLAAKRFGFTFEGVFRQHMVAKGANRDTAWFSIIDSEWPRLRASFEAWLSPDNFDERGRQLKRLVKMREGHSS
ncbi:GNAT family N-acetyltransferase [Nitratireductor basaltis]|uniref:N-acetyltransferase GCN5 n=1 Tax=Nitratireductor basaltis TaxID=472175 RepID=A0A084U865_9HYPH|nr:GNAT family protein [Nitratireductor basaltis]KFB09151.1 N-acetyltransferase GCN5 [Nitratireductor basaltis]